MRREQLLLADTLEYASFNLGKAQVSAEEAQRIAEFLDEYLTSLQSDEGVCLDGTVTDEPDTGEMFRDDLGKSYSATHQWLVKFRDFCRSSNGFVVD